MKTNQLSAGVNLVLSIGLAALTTLLVFRVLNGMKIPLIQGNRAALVTVFVLGFAMCGLGVRRISATGQWLHPLTIISYVLGILTALFAAAGYFDFRFTFIHNPLGAMVAVSAMIVLKLTAGIVHRLI